MNKSILFSLILSLLFTGCSTQLCRKAQVEQVIIRNIRDFEAIVNQIDSLNVDITNPNSCALKIDLSLNPDTSFRISFTTDTLRKYESKKFTIFFHPKSARRVSNTLTIKGFCKDDVPAFDDIPIPISGKGMPEKILSKTRYHLSSGLIGSKSKIDTSSIIIKTQNKHVLGVAFEIRPNSPFKIRQDTIHIRKMESIEVPIEFDSLRPGIFIDTLKIKYITDGNFTIPDTQIVVQGESIKEEKDENSQKLISGLKKLDETLNDLLADTLGTSGKSIEDLENKYVKAITGAFKECQTYFDEFCKNQFNREIADTNAVVLFNDNPTHYKILNKRHLNYGVDFINLNNFAENTAFDVPTSFPELKPISHEISKDDTLLLYFNKGFSQIRSNIMNTDWSSFTEINTNNAFDVCKDILVNLLSNIDYDLTYYALYKDGNVFGSYLNTLEFLAKYFQYIGVNNEDIEIFIQTYFEVMKLRIESDVHDSTFCDLLVNTVWVTIDSCKNKLSPEITTLISLELKNLDWVKYGLKYSKKLNSRFYKFVKIIKMVEALISVVDFMDNYMRFMADWYLVNETTFQISPGMNRAKLLFSKCNTEYDQKKYETVGKGALKDYDTLFQQGNKFIFNVYNKYDCTLNNFRTGPTLMEKEEIDNDSFEISFQVFPEEEFEYYLANDLSKRNGFFYYSGVALILVSEDSRELCRFEINYVKHSKVEKIQKQISWEIHSPRDSMILKQEYGAADAIIQSYPYRSVTINRFRKELDLKKDDFMKKLKLKVIGTKKAENRYAISIYYSLDGKDYPFTEFRNGSNTFILSGSKLKKGFSLIHNSHNGRLKAFWKLAEF